MSSLLTLTSNVDQEGFTAKNTNSTFTTKLEAPLSYGSEKWEVGLLDMHFPTSWKNVEEGKITVRRISDGANITLEMRRGRYTSLAQLTEEIWNVTTVANVHHLFAVYTDNVRGKACVVVLPALEKVEFSDDLSEILGLRRRVTFAAGTHIGAYSPDINRGFSSLFVYCDLAEPRPVGNVMAPLLRTVPVSPTSTSSTSIVESTYIEFRNVQYTRMKATRTDLVTVNIRTDSGHEVPFTGGKVALTVHIRPISS
jgi:hypothetical protein